MLQLRVRTAAAAPEPTKRQHLPGAFTRHKPQPLTTVVSPLKPGEEDSIIWSIYLEMTFYRGGGLLLAMGF